MVPWQVSVPWVDWSGPVPQPCRCQKRSRWTSLWNHKVYFSSSSVERVELFKNKGRRTFSKSQLVAFYVFFPFCVGVFSCNLQFARFLFAKFGRHRLRGSKTSKPFVGAWCNPWLSWHLLWTNGSFGFQRISICGFASSKITLHVLGKLCKPGQLKMVLRPKQSQTPRQGEFPCQALWKYCFTCDLMYV